MENKHKAAGKESMVIKNQKQNALRTKQKGSKVTFVAPKGKKSR